MTVYINIGRRVPRNWYKRQASKILGLINFQSNLWVIITHSLNLAKKRANESKTLEFSLTKKYEKEDLHYELEWICIVIRGTPEQEQEEYNDAMKLYDSLGRVFKKDMPVDENLSKHFKTKILNMSQIEEAYKKGYGAVVDTSIAQKLLEMGILTHIEYDKDYDKRQPIFPLK